MTIAVSAATRRPVKPDGLSLQPAPQAGRIVVAVDGHASAARALAWAADEARCRGMSIRLVTSIVEEQDPSRARTAEQAVRRQRQLCDRIRRDQPWLNGVEYIVGRGSLLSVVGEATRPKDLLVLGGADGRTADLLQRAPCPVVVVPAEG